LRSRWLAACGCLAAALALGVGACGGGSNNSSSSSGGGGGGGKTLTIYSSEPLQGASRANTISLVNGEKLALEQAGNRAGKFKIKFASLDDSTAQAGQWTPEATSANARKAAQDKNTGIYIGEFNSGATAVSLPILNEAGVPQISAANTAVGLTTKDITQPGTPDKYYPAGKRTFARIVPRDTIQGAALVGVMKSDGCTKVEMTNDKQVYGAGLSAQIQDAAKKQGLDILANDAIDVQAPNYRSLAQKAKSAGADCMVYAGITANNAVQLTKDFAAALPNGKLYGGDGICEPGYVDPKEGGIPTSLDSRVQCTVPTLSPAQYPQSGKEFVKAFQQKYGVKNPPPYAIYGYEAMALALDAIKRSGDGSHDGVLKALFATKDRQSVLGTYSIDKNGDTTTTDYGLYGVKNGELVFKKTIKANA
jgi:branched-chain amino acid transport system substrate-binding protein